MIMICLFSVQRSLIRKRDRYSVAWTNCPQTWSTMLRKTMSCLTRRWKSGMPCRPAKPSKKNWLWPQQQYLHLLHPPTQLLLLPLSQWVLSLALQTTQVRVMALRILSGILNTKSIFWRKMNIKKSFTQETYKRLRKWPWYIGMLPCNLNSLWHVIILLICYTVEYKGKGLVLKVKAAHNTVKIFSHSVHSLQTVLL